VQKLSDEIHKAVETPEVKAKLLSWDSPPIGSTPEAFAKFFQSEHEKFANIVKVSNVPMQ
jgi:tripartite-type tricarboxylate transporter receptor subunit TctC